MIFPGQGSQKIGMGESLYKNFPTAKAVFEEVDDALNQKLSDIIFHGSEKELTLTENAQPALMAVSMALVRLLEQEGNITLKDHFTFLAGHSLGEYTACCAAGVFSISDTARLLKSRGCAMQKAVPDGEGAMAAILNLDFEVVYNICSDLSEQDALYCTIANDNSESQIVISGTDKAIDKACIIAKEKGAKRALRLPVSAPFHCDLMQNAADVMDTELSSVAMNQANIPIINNIDVMAVTKADHIKTALVRQVTGRVRWRETMDYAVKQQINSIFEIGSGKVLTNLFKRSHKDINAISVEDSEGINAMLKAL